MMKYINKKTTMLSAASLAGLMTGISEAHAGSNNFGDIAENIQKSIADVPGLLSALSYLFGILLGVLGIMKIKDHVENPTQTHLKDGAIRLAAGGGLFALPIIFEAMQNTVGTDGVMTMEQLNAVSFGVKGTTP